MLRIRFLRIGKKNAPSFRIVLTEKTAPPQGRFLEILGFYNPRSKETNLKKERIMHWLSKGAKPSATVHNLLVRQGVIKCPKIKKKIEIKTKEEPKEAKKEKPKEEKQSKEAVEKDGQINYGGWTSIVRLLLDKTSEESKLKEA